MECSLKVLFEPSAKNKIQAKLYLLENISTDVSVCVCVSVCLLKRFGLLNRTVLAQYYFKNIYKYI